MATATDTILTAVNALKAELAVVKKALEEAKAPASRVTAAEEFFAAAIGSTKSGGMPGTWDPARGFVPTVARNGRKSLFPDGSPHQSEWRKMLKGLTVLHGRNARPSDQAWAMKQLFDESGEAGRTQRVWAKSFGGGAAQGTAAPVQFEKVALAESSGVTGGYTVPPIFSSQMLSLSVEESIFAQMAYKQPMTSLTQMMPYLDIVTPNGVGVSNLLAGIIPTWTAEAAQRTESEPRFRMFELKANELSMIAVASNTLLADDAVGLDALLTQLFPKAIAWFTDFAYFQGNGVGKPLGVLNANAALRIDRAAAGRFQYQDAANMVQRMYGPDAFRKKKVAWCMHPFALNQLLQMYDGNNRVIWVPLNQGATEFPADTGHGGWSAGKLLGYDVFLTEKLPSFGSPGDVCLIDFEAYVLGDRQELEIEVSPWPLFQTNQMMYRLVWRGDGQSWLSAPITLASGASDQVSPFVLLN